MRLSEILESKLSFMDAKKFLKNIEFGQGGMQEIANDNTWLVEACQNEFQRKYGNNVSVYRALTLTGDVRSDKIVSTTLDWGVAYKIMEMAPGVVFGDNKSMQLSHAILHYRINPDHVRIYVPYALEYVKKTVGKRSNHSIEDRNGDKVKISSIYDFLKDGGEQEVVADVSGLRPKIIEFKTSVKHIPKRKVFYDVMSGKLSRNNISEYVENEKKFYSGFFDEEIVMKYIDEIIKWKS